MTASRPCLLPGPCAVLARLALTCALLIHGQALGHPQILFANVTSEPAAPPAGEPFTLRVELRDSSGSAVTDLELGLAIHQPGSDLDVAEADAAAENGEGSGSDEAPVGGDAAAEAVAGDETGDGAGEADAGVAGDVGSEAADAPLARVELGRAREDGVYAGEVPPLPAGEYPFRLAEMVDGNIESNAVGELPVGAEEPLALELLMPPVTAGFGAWLVWLVGLPLLAGLLVTILVLTNRGKSEQE